MFFTLEKCFVRKSFQVLVDSGLDFITKPFYTVIIWALYRCTDNFLFVLVNSIFYHGNSSFIDNPQFYNKTNTACE